MGLGWTPSLGAQLVMAAIGLALGALWWNAWARHKSRRQARENIVLDQAVGQMNRKDRPREPRHGQATSVCCGEPQGAFASESGDDE